MSPRSGRISAALGALNGKQILRFHALVFFLIAFFPMYLGFGLFFQGTTELCIDACQFSILVCKIFCGIDY